MTDGNSRPVLLHGYAPLIPAPMAPNEAARTRGDRPSSKPLGLTKRSECDRPGRDGMQPTFPKREVAAIRRHVRITVNLSSARIGTDESVLSPKWVVSGVQIQTGVYEVLVMYAQYSVHVNTHLPTYLPPT
jgi:hypothetical protein